MTQNRQGLAGGPQTLRDQETAQNLRRGIAEGTQEGRTIVMTTPWGLWGELRAADILGRKVLGWDIDRQNRTAYVYLHREAAEEVPLIHLVDTDAWDGSWQRRLRALDAITPSARLSRLSPVGKIVAWFSGRNRGTATVQEGGAR